MANPNSTDNLHSLAVPAISTFGKDALGNTSIGMPKLGPLDITNGRGLAEPGEKASMLRAANYGCAQGAPSI
ncbi:hypothetical protein J2S34_001930 [Nitrobacter winogradskyi]|uniref:Uncharacterized protein n=2 Tax=Nitrobacter winogradskyi TaxID=913 RepID=A0ACC6AJW7_NITWI|nr:hypothetical protein [Nitrobacter winogradskyi]GEC16146.1 hypothetical protein NWI01_20380 [Nitrobacter winogradskyi]